MVNALRLTVVATLLAIAVPGTAQLDVAPSGTLSVFGDSSLHKWEVATSTASMKFTLRPGAPADLGAAIKAAKVQTMEVRIAVADLTSGEKGLDENMRVAMRAKKYPEILYKLGHYEVGKPSESDVIASKTTGELTIAGQTKTVTMDVEFTLGAGAAKAKGSCTLKMSDYGIKPPTLMLGTIKVRDPVTIRFDLRLNSQAEAKKTGA